MQILYSHRTLAGAHHGAARHGAGAAAGSARGCAAGLASRRVDERNAVFVERWKSVRWRGRRRRAGPRDLVGGSAGVVREDSRGDGNSAQRVSLGSRESQLRGGAVSRRPKLQVAVVERVLSTQTVPESAENRARDLTSADYGPAKHKRSSS